MGLDMTLKYLLHTLCLLSLINLPVSVSAAIIEGTFSGVITEAQDGNDHDNGLRDIWSGDITGQAVTGNFWYDLSLAPANTGHPNMPNKAIYFSRSNWVGMSFNINGKVYNVSYDNPGGLPVTAIVDVVTMDDNVPISDSENRDSVGIYDETLFGDEALEYELRTGFLAFSETVADVLNGVDLKQQFDWDNRAGSSIGGTGVFEVQGFLDGQYGYGRATMDIFEIHAALRNGSAVPEPSSLILLALSFGALLFRRMNV